MTRQANLNFLTFLNLEVGGYIFDVALANIFLGKKVKKVKTVVENQGVTLDGNNLNFL